MHISSRCKNFNSVVNTIWTGQYISEYKTRHTTFIMLRLQVFIEGEYRFISNADPSMTIESYCFQLETELHMIFEKSVPIKILGIQDAHRNDLHPHYTVGSIFAQDDFVFPIRDLLMIQQGEVTPLVLAIPDKFHMEAPHEDSMEGDPAPQSPPRRRTVSHVAHPPTLPPARCKPYCRPLAHDGDRHSLCRVCAQVRAYLPPADGQYCTQLCYSGETRKVKSQGMDFCSICLSRYRQSKYARSVVHQCGKCHRPWLILNREGICRTCHCGGVVKGRTKGKPSAKRRSGDRPPFRPDPQRIEMID
eukprot:gnl/Dysnectes_brevis/3452_a4373_721.p1 GENE.gnl/Dysnectes_brevis/3452_a4373_721~~gnl/Dysnectes_brevis/3452_a4373_721.p1  ORF type:complete len:304 (-),score=30.54 gnl/Dysnectes_brevis/3452_a4373_721:402-1313(-)